MTQNSKSNSRGECTNCDNNNSNDYDSYYKYQVITGLMNQVSQLDAFNRLYERRDNHNGYDRHDESDFLPIQFDVAPPLPHGFNNFHGNPGFNFGNNRSPFGINIIFQYNFLISSLILNIFNSIF